MNWKSKAIIVTVAILAIVSGLTSLGVVLARNSGTDSQTPISSNQEGPQGILAEQGTQVVGELVTESFTGSVTVSYDIDDPFWCIYPNTRHVSLTLAYSGIDESDDEILLTNWMGNMGCYLLYVDTSSAGIGGGGYESLEFDADAWTLSIRDEGGQPRICVEGHRYLS